jgi:hypothetical protein
MNHEMKTSTPDIQVQRMQVTQITNANKFLGIRWCPVRTVDREIGSEASGIGPAVVRVLASQGTEEWILLQQVFVSHGEVPASIAIHPCAS